MEINVETFYDILSSEIDSLFTERVIATTDYTNYAGGVAGYNSHDRERNIREIMTALAKCLLQGRDTYCVNKVIDKIIKEETANIYFNHEINTQRLREQQKRAENAEKQRAKARADKEKRKK